VIVVARVIKNAAMVVVVLKDTDVSLETNVSKVLELRIQMIQMIQLVRRALLRLFWLCLVAAVVVVESPVSRGGSGTTKARQQPKHHQ
jgi:hypothetical protein